MSEGAGAMKAASETSLSADNPEDWARNPAESVSEGAGATALKGLVKMNKPSGWEAATPYDGVRRRLPPGGYVCAIKGARVKAGRYGEQMELEMDICEGAFAGFYGDLYEARAKAGSQYGVKWPCVFYQSILNRDGLTNGWFKGLITSVEQSNAGYAWSWDENTLKGKRVGFVSGEEEWVDANGEIRTSTKPKMARDAQAIRDGDFEVPPKRAPADGGAGRGVAYATAGTGGAGAHDGGFTRVDEELPF